MVSFVPNLFGYFLGIPSLYVFSFFEMLFCNFIIDGLDLPLSITSVPLVGMLITREHESHTSFFLMSMNILTRRYTS